MSAAQKMTYHFINSDVMSRYYDVMTDSSKSVRFMWHEKFSNLMISAKFSQIL